MNIKNNTLATEQFVQEQLLQNQSDWNQSDSLQNSHIKNRTHYDDTASGGELKKLDKKYLPDEVVNCQTAKVGQIIIVKSVNENGIPVEWKAVDGQNNQNGLILKDKTTGYEYIVYIDKGGLETCVRVDNIKVSTLPNKTDYTDTELFDPTGMVIIATNQDGSEFVITDYTYDKYVTIGSTTHEIRYEQAGIIHTIEIPITTRTLEISLIDFEYTTNDDGTYTLTGWKGTLNGEPSTRLIVPNSELVIV